MKRALTVCCLLAVHLPAMSQHLADPAYESPGGAWHYFPNYGQLLTSDSTPASNVMYYTERGASQVFITDSFVSYVHYQPGDSALSIPDSGARLDMQFVSDYQGFDKYKICPLDISVEEPAGDSLNFYLPHCQNGITGVPGYGRVVFTDVYPNIDVHYYSQNNGPVLYFVVRPGGNPANITMRFTGQH